MAGKEKDLTEAYRYGMGCPSLINMEAEDVLAELNKAGAELDPSRPVLFGIE